MVISKMFSQASNNDIAAVIDAAQRHIYATWNGFQPVGTSETIPKRAVYDFSRRP